MTASASSRARGVGVAGVQIALPTVVFGVCPHLAGKKCGQENPVSMRVPAVCPQCPQCPQCAGHGSPSAAYFTRRIELCQAGAAASIIGAAGIKLRKHCGHCGQSSRSSATMRDAPGWRVWAKCGQSAGKVWAIRASSAYREKDETLSLIRHWVLVELDHPRAQRSLNFDCSTRLLRGLSKGLALKVHGSFQPPRIHGPKRARDRASTKFGGMVKKTVDWLRNVPIVLAGSVAIALRYQDFEALAQSVRYGCDSGDHGKKCGAHLLAAPPFHPDFTTVCRRVHIRK
jgi:hypothetical protein